MALLFSVLLSLGSSSMFIIWMNDGHAAFVDDLNFPFYDYVVVLDLPGLWIPYKDEVCVDFADTWIGLGWPC